MEVKMKEKLEKLNDFEWKLPKTVRKEMKVDAKIIANKKILNAIEEDAVEQLTNVATLPGVIEPVVGLPDMHWGFTSSEKLFVPQTDFPWARFLHLTLKMA